MNSLGTKYDLIKYIVDCVDNIIEHECRRKTKLPHRADQHIKVQNLIKRKITNSKRRFKG